MDISIITNYGRVGTLPLPHTLHNFVHPSVCLGRRLEVENRFSMHYS